MVKGGLDEKNCYLIIYIIKKYYYLKNEINRLNKKMEKLDNNSK